MQTIIIKKGFSPFRKELYFEMLDTLEITEEDIELINNLPMLCNGDFTHDGQKYIKCKNKEGGNTYFRIIYIKTNKNDFLEIKKGFIKQKEITNTKGIIFEKSGFNYAELIE